MGIWRLIAQRAMQLIPVVLGISVLAFLLLNLLPGNAAIAIVGPTGTPQAIANIDKELGLNHPLWYRYGVWLWQALQGHLGKSLITNQTVVSLIAQRIPVTLELLVLAVFIALIVAIPVAIISARRPFGVFDWLSRSSAMTALSLPGFVLALVLILLLSVRFTIFPTLGFTSLSQSLSGNLKTMVLPALSLSFSLFGSYSRILRADLVQQMKDEEYISLARIKGISEARVLVVHALRNSVFSLITVVGTNIGPLLGGSVIIETIFGLPGIGQLLQSSIYNRDAPVVQGIIVIVAFGVVVVNLLTDLAYSALDPRIRHGFSRS